jgi:hypothetical protein
MMAWRISARESTTIIPISLSAYPVSGFADAKGARRQPQSGVAKEASSEVDIVRWPNLLGLFYAQFAAWLGFESWRRHYNLRRRGLLE